MTLKLKKKKKINETLKLKNKFFANVFNMKKSFVFVQNFVTKMIKKKKTKRFIILLSLIRASNLDFCKTNKHYILQNDQFGYRDECVEYSRSLKRVRKKNINLIKKISFASIVPNTTIFKFRFLYDFTMFRVNKFNFIARSNPNSSYFFSLYEIFNNIFGAARFPRKYTNTMALSFSFLCVTKDLNKFAVFIKRLIELLPRNEQKNFFYTFSCVDSVSFLSFLKMNDVHGFYLRARGKIGGYVGDRTKSFLIRYGRYSRSKRLYKYSFLQTVAFTKPGAIGIDMLLVYK